MPHIRLYPWPAVVAINVVMMAVVLTCVELAFGNWFQPFVPPNAAIVNRTYVYQQSLYRPHGRVVYVRDKYGLRGVQEPLSQIDLVTVGGSTTDQRYLTEGETWQDVLRKLAGLRVANAGVDGMSSRGHIVAVAEWLHKIPKFSPRYYLHYLGVNDAALSQSGRQNENDRSGTESAWLWSVRRRSVVVNLLGRLLTDATGSRPVGHGAIIANPGAQMIKVDTQQGEAERFVEVVYKPNLGRLLALHHERREMAILVSQTAHPSLIRWHDGETFVSNDFPELAPLAGALAIINRASRKICRDNAVVCRFIDLAGVMPVEPRDFYDAFHATPAGAHNIGAFLARELAFVSANPDPRREAQDGATIGAPLPRGRHE